MNTLINQVRHGMFRYFSGDPKRIQHLVKVHSFAKYLGEMEHLQGLALVTLEIAALVHDIGIKNAELKFGNCNGKLQEQEGPAEAEHLLKELGVPNEITERVVYLVGHHHTYLNIEGMDYQILVEADFLVNFYEDELGKEAVARTIEHIFKTESGKITAKEIFGIDQI